MQSEQGPCIKLWYQMQCIRSPVSEGIGSFYKKMTNRQSRVNLETKMGTLYTWMSKNKLCYETKANKLTVPESFLYVYVFFINNNKKTPSN